MGGLTGLGGMDWVRGIVCCGRHFLADSSVLTGTRAMYVWTKEKMTGQKINVPSWCDRVLWKSYPCLTSINTSYGMAIRIRVINYPLSS